MAFPDVTPATNDAALQEFVNRSSVTDITGGYNIISRLCAWAASCMVSSPPAATVLTTSSIKSSGAAAGIGYATGAGAAVTQGTNRTTAVTCNGMSGSITLISAAGSATPASFTVNNTSILAGDVVIVTQKSGTDKYEIFVTQITTGTSFVITSFTTGGTTTEQPVFNFAIIRAVSA